MSARLLARRWPLYALTCAGVYLLQLLFIRFAHVAHADRFAALIGSPLISVVVMVHAGTDALGVAGEAVKRWERIIDRAWAVLVVDAGINLAFIAVQRADSGANGDPVFATFATLTVAALLVYTEPFICLESHASPFGLVPAALAASLRLAWSNLPRVFYLMAFALALDILESVLLRAGQGLPAQSIELWIDLPFQALVTLPLSALFTVAYLDTAARARTAP